MDLVIVVLGILYLCGVGVGKALAICAIIEGVLIFIKAVLEAKQKKREKDAELMQTLFGEDKE